HADRENGAFERQFRHGQLGDQPIDGARVALVAVACAHPLPLLLRQRLACPLQLLRASAGQEDGRGGSLEQHLRALVADALARPGDDDHGDPQRTSWIAPAKPAPTAPRQSQLPGTNLPAAAASASAIATEADVVFAYLGKLIHAFSSGMSRSCRICRRRNRLGWWRQKHPTSLSGTFVSATKRSV